MALFTRRRFRVFRGIRRLAEIFQAFLLCGTVSNQIDFGVIARRLKRTAKKLYHDTPLMKSFAWSFLCLIGVSLVDRMAGFSDAIDPLYILPIWFATRQGGLSCGVGMVGVVTFTMTLFEFSLGQIHPSSWPVHASLRFCVLGSIMGFIHKLDERIRHAEMKAIHDPLTGLANRAGLKNFGTQLIAKAKRDGVPTTIAMVDCDKFKELNDQLGHAAGDAVLQLVAKCLKAGLKKYGLVARTGGDEFVAVLTNCEADEARFVLEKVRSKFMRTAEGQGLPCTFTFGIAQIGRGGTTLPSLIDAADKDMYHRKLGRGSFAVVESSSRLLAS